MTSLASPRTTQAATLGFSFACLTAMAYMPWLAGQKKNAKTQYLAIRLLVTNSH
jgi:hypothetical protein